MQHATRNMQHATCRRATHILDRRRNTRPLQDESVVAELLVAFESLVLEDDTSTVLCTPLVIT